MAELESGSVVDGCYEILATIGSGGLGTVYRARDVNADATVAVKMLNISGDEAQRRFLREFNILSRIRHPRIIVSHRWGIHDGNPYFSMDYVQGRPLSDVISGVEDRERLKTEWLLQFVRQIGEGLSYIHENGLVHRDLKPSNIMISEDEGEPDVTILDLGLARFQDSLGRRLTPPGTTTGTMEYMSPEQIRGRSVDQRSDLYSLGIILYEVLTGKPPFTGENPAAVMLRHLRDLPKAPIVQGISGQIRSVVMRLLEKEPIDRYSSVGLLLRDLPEVDDQSSEQETAAAPVSISPAPFLAPQFQGREREMKVLREILRGSEGGVGRMVLISGEAGIGKTQILEEFQADARVHGMRILKGRCYESGGRAYGPFLEALTDLADRPDIQGSDQEEAVKRVLAQIDRAMAGDQKDPYPVIEILAEFFSDLSRETPTLVCIDDIQWADDLSMRILDFLRRDADPSPLVFGLACRKEDEDQLPVRIQDVFPDSAAPGVVHLRLKPLSLEETTNLAASILGEPIVPDDEARRIREETGGNPLFAVELVRGAIENGSIRQDLAGGWTWPRPSVWPMPAGITQAIESRLGRLRSDRRRVLEYASIFRGAFSFDLISEVWRGDELRLLEALEGLVRLGLLRALEDREGRYRFSHGLIQRAVYRGILERKRVLLHLEAGRALEKRFEKDGADVLDDLAFHFSRANNLEKVAHYLTSSGRWAVRMHDFSRALEQFETVLEQGAFSKDAPAAVSEGSVPHLDFLCGYTEALLGCYRFEEARRVLDGAMRWVSNKTPSQKADLLRMLGINVSHFGDNERAACLWLQALELYRSVGDGENELTVLGHLSNVYVELDNRDEAVRHCRLAAEKCRELGGRVYEARASINLAFAEDITYQTDRSRALLESAIDLLNFAEDRIYRYSCLYLLARIDIRLGDFDRAERVFLELRDFWERCGSKRAEAEACHYLGKIALEKDDGEGAQRYASMAQRLLADEMRGNEFFGACALLAEGLALAGRAEEALEWVERASPGVEAGGNIRAAILIAKAKSLAAAGRHDEVESVLGRAVELQYPPKDMEHVRQLLFAGTYYAERSCLKDAQFFLETARVASEEMGLRHYARKALDLLNRIPSDAGSTSPTTQISMALSTSHLATLYEISGDLTSVLDLNVLLDRILNRLTKVSRAERVMIAIKDQKAFGVHVARAHNLDDALTREISEGIIKTAVDRNETIFSLDARVDERFRQQDSVAAYGIRSVLCVPLHHVESGVIGALYMDHRGLKNLFTENDRAFLTAFANLVSLAVVNARMYSKIAERALYLQKQFEDRYKLEELVGKSEAMHEAFNLIGHAAESDVNVLIRGETGTGKELAAKAIHVLSKRKEQPYLSANCASFTQELLQSELFGHKKGAFTGAISDRKGLFESADGGTVLLDEIGDASPQLQSSLLRVLQVGELQRVGETQVRNVDVRVIAATNRDLDADVRKGQFREDLYYRLGVLQIEMPPLRDHIEDIPLLSEHILERVCADQRKSVPGFTVGAIRALMDHGWPGNVRELENEIRRAVVLVEDGAKITADLFSDKIGLTVELKDREDSYFKARVAALEKRMIIDALDKCGGNITRSADQLGLSRNGLQKMMTRYGLRNGV